MTELPINTTREVVIIDNDHRTRPDWWDNFVDSLPAGGQTSRELWYEQRDQHLAMWGAVLKYDKGSARLIFEKESDCMMFMLKYSR